MGHVPQHGEDDEPCQEAGQTVYTTRHYGVPGTVNKIQLAALQAVLWI